MTAAPEKPALLLITGSRAFWDWGLFDAAMDEACSTLRTRGFQRLVVVHGAARKGADKHAHLWARRRISAGVEERRFPADWDGPCTTACIPNHRKPSSLAPGGTYCPAEGPRRNQRMIDHVTAQQAPHGALALVFYAPGRKTPGTRDCERRLLAACMPHRCFTSVKPAAAR